MDIISTQGLTKQYKRYKKQEGLIGSVKGLFTRDYEVKTAVNQVDLQMKEGEFVGLIGPNGAGKTTLVKMLTGIIAPSFGKVNVLGYYPNNLENSFKEQYAIVMGQKSQLFFELTAQDSLHLFKEIYGIDKEEFERNKFYFVQLFEVEEIMDVPVRTLSLGERMKMELIVALLHNPKILFLDEPTIGLDAIAGKQVRMFLKKVNQERGTTILLTSHYMEDIKTLCNRSIVINHGEKVYDGETKHLFETYQLKKRIKVVFDKPTNIDAKDFQGTVVEENPYRKVFDIPKEKVKNALYAMLALEPEDISIEEEEIGKVVERIYKRRSLNA